MKKTYIATMPNKIGAFLKASECFSALGINITRISYNKAVDSHTLFMDVDGTAEQLEKADEELKKLGYLDYEGHEKNVVLLEFTLKDKPGKVTELLRLINECALNISYISTQDSGRSLQNIKVGLLIRHEKELDAFLHKAELLCPVHVLEYNHSEKIYDNSIFYRSFVSGLMETGGLAEEAREELLVMSNRIMQMKDETGQSPYRTFESISRFAELLAESRGAAFQPRITEHRLAEHTTLTLIEPPCGSNTMILRSYDEVLFIDCGYALYRKEMKRLLRKLLPDFDHMHKRIFLTHADLDHCGLLDLFDEVIATERTKHCIELEYAGEDGYREQLPEHKPYIRICKALTHYQPCDPSRIHTPWKHFETLDGLLTQVGFFDVGEMHFEVYVAQGGHVPGETILIDYEHRIAFTGDVYFNVHAVTPQQAEYNRYAPVLLSSVDTDPARCAAERRAIMNRLGMGDWQVFGSHGMKKEYALELHQE